MLYEEVYRKRLELLKSSKENIKEQLKKIEDEIMDAYSKGKITELHYTLLKEKITEYGGKN